MEGPGHDRVREIFFRCCEAPETERRAILASLRREDPDLCDEVESLLRFDGKTDAFGDEAIPAADSIAPAPHNQAMPERVGDCRILGVLGEGGSGVVYEAEQDSPRRRVALKVLRAGLVTASMRKRFAREAEVVGRLQHPGIAQVYAADASGERNDVPHIAMELVRGMPLTRFAEGRTTRERLELFCLVCDAVQYAHEMGVVHRDLKPGNILVDEEGRPKVLDFGVARLIDSDLMTITSHTHAGQIIGTVPYMSPEQIRGDADEISKATDVYALGVVLFELLTGDLPHDIHGRSILEAVRIKSEQEPTRLGTRNRSFRGDLDLIVATALEPRPQDRYPSVAAMASDIRRYLASEPISVRPRSAPYRVAKFVRRNRLLVGAASALFVVLTAATVISTVFGLRQLDARKTAEAATTKALEQEAVTKRINGFLTDDLLGAVHPLRAKGEEVLVRDVLEQAATKLDEGDLADQPAVASALHLTVGGVYRALGVYDEAEAHLRRGLDLAIQCYGQSSRQAANAWSDLGGLLHETDRLEEAEQSYAAALDILRRVSEPDARAQASAMLNLALARKTLGRFDEAETLYLESLQMYQGLGSGFEKELANSHHNLGSLYRALGRFRESADQFRAALAIQREVHHDNSPEVAFTAGMLASVEDRLGNTQEADRLLDFSQQVLERVYGPTHQYVATAMSNRAKFLTGHGDDEKALELYERAAEIYAAALGTQHHFYGVVQSNIGKLLLERGEFDAAEGYLETALGIYEKSLPLDHPSRGRILALMARVQLGKAEPERAIALFEEALGILEKVSDTAEELMPCRLGLAEALLDAGRPEDAATQLETARKAMDASPETPQSSRAQLGALEARLR